MAAKIRKGDKVVVLTGRDKGRTGEVIEVRPAEGRALVPLDDVDALDDDARLGGKDAQDLAGLALVLAGEHDDAVAFFDLGGHGV